MCVFGFGNSTKQLSNMVVLIHSHEQYMSSSCSTSSLRGCHFIPFPSSHSGGCELVPHCVLICEHLIIRAIFVSTNVKFLCKSFAHWEQNNSYLSFSYRCQSFLIQVLCQIDASWISSSNLNLIFFPLQSFPLCMCTC